jgi:hypothetical protein
MTPASVEAKFEREYGCTTTEWQRWLPGAVRDCTLQLPTASSARARIGSGHLALHWTVLPPRRIALMTMPRLQVQFDFVNTSAEERLLFMRYFDLYMQRGGG